jgi:hypothetical protein
MVPPNTIALTARQRITFILLLFSAVGASLLVLTWDLRPYPLAAFVDDYRYVLSAIHIKAALWTLSLLHLPFIQTMLLLYPVANAGRLDRLDCASKLLFEDSRTINRPAMD